MKYITLFCLVASLIASLALTGCDRDPQPSETQNPPEVSLELGEDIPEEEPDEPLEESASAEEESKEEQPDKKPDELLSETKNPDTEQPEPETEKPSTQQTPAPQQETQTAQSTSKLPFSQELQTRPQDELKNNPKNLDTRLYSVFKNSMEQNFSRKKGTLSIYRLNTDGTEGAYELTFDLNSAYDKKGNLNKNGPVKAEMKAAETLQAGINYGQGSTETYKTYKEYTEALEKMKTPLLSSDGFQLKNFSSLTMTEEDGHYLIEATYTSSALEDLLDEKTEGEVFSYIQLDAEGNIEQLGWEQLKVIDDYPKTIACGEYDFK